MAVTLGSSLQSSATALFVGFGGALGALLRFGSDRLGAALGWPAWGVTCSINIVGCFAIGWLFVQLEARFRAHGASLLEPTPQFPRLQAHGWLLGPDPTLPAVELFRAEQQLRFLSGLLLSGFLGGFTTFSTFGLQTVLLFRDGMHLAAATNVVGTLALTLLATLAGMASAERALRSPAGADPPTPAT